MKAKEIAKLLNLDNECIRKLITDIARKGYMPESLYSIENIEDGFSKKHSYFFKETSIPYIKNFIYLYSIIGTPKDTFNILNKKISENEIKKLLNEKRTFLEKKYSIYRNSLYNYDNLISLLVDEKNDLKKIIIQTENKLMAIEVIEEIEKNIKNNPDKLLELVKMQVEIKDLNQALKNVNRVIEIDPEKIEAYNIKGQIYFELMNEPSKKVSEYKIMQESSESSSSYHIYEEMISEEDFECQKLYRSGINSYIEIYKLIKKGRNNISYDYEKTCKFKILNHYINVYINNSSGSLNIYNKKRNQKDRFIHYKKTGEILEEKGILNNEDKEIILDILIMPSLVNFDNDEFIIDNLMTLEFYLLFDFEKYIKFSEFYFNSLKKMNLENINPFMLNTYLSHKHEDSNLKSRYWIFKEHFFMNLNEEEVLSFTKLLNEKSIEKIKNDNETVSLLTYKVDYFNKLYQNKNYDKLLNQLENTLKELSEEVPIYSGNHIKVLYTHLHLIYELSSNEIRLENYTKALKYLNKILNVDIKLLKKVEMATLYQLSWKYQCSYVEGAKDEYGTDILGCSVDDFNFRKDYDSYGYKISIPKLLNIVGNNISDSEQTKILEKLKIYLHA